VNERTVFKLTGKTKAKLVEAGLHMEATVKAEALRFNKHWSATELGKWLARSVFPDYYKFAVLAAKKAHPMF
jgi:hypothetical protein